MSRRAYVELKLGKTLTGWTADGSNYKRSTTAAELTFAGVIRPIVGAESMIAPRELIRVERVSDMTTGTWFWDDAALAAGGSADLYVRLPTATDPDDATAGLVVLLLFCFGAGDENGDAEVHPLLGDNKYLNPGVETWAAGAPTGWTEYGAGAVQETSNVLDGQSSALIGSGSVAAAALDGIGQPRVGIQGAQYRVSGYYQTPLTGQSPDVEVRLRVGDGTSWVMSDGRGLTTVDGGIRLADTQGELRRFLFDFVWTGATTAALQADLLLYNAGAAAAAGLLYVDRGSFKRIWRWNVYENNLAASAIPELSIQSQSILFGAKTIGFGSVTLVDADGELAKAVASLLVLQKPANVYVGGSFREGDEIHRDDWRGVFPAIIRKPEIAPGSITLELENAQALALAKAAERKHRVAEAATMARSEENLAKPLVFGTPWDTGGATFQHIIPAVRVAANASTGYGEYEYLDPYIPVRDGVDVDLPAAYSIKVFPNRELADLNLQGYVITDSTNDFDVTNNKTRWRVKRDIRNYRYDKSGEEVGSNRTFDFDITAGLGAALRVSMDLLGPAYKVAADLQAAMRTAIGGGDTTTTVVYSETTHKFTVARSAGTLDLHMTTSKTNTAHASGWELLGFDTRTDKTGATTYAGDDATFTNADEDHVIRFPGGGYRDDAAGSICGVANVAIDSWPAIASWLLQKRLNVPASRIDVPSFMDAREQTRDFDFALVFATFEDANVVEALAIAEKVAIMNLVPDGEGVWHCIRHKAGTAGAREFFDEDYIRDSWRMWLDPTALYKEVRVLGDWNPSQQRFMTYGDAVGVLDPLIPLKHGDERILEIPGYIERQYIVGGTLQVANHYARLIAKVPRVVSFEASSKLVDQLPGYKVILNRTGPGVLDPTGELAGVAFRIIALTQRYSTTGISRCVAVEDVEFLT